MWPSSERMPNREEKDMNLKELNWTHPLVASVRLALAGRLIPTSVLAPVGHEENDNDIKSFLREYDAVLQDSRKRVRHEPDAPAIPVVFWLKTGNVAARTVSRVTGHTATITDVLALQRNFAEELRTLTAGLSDCRALAVLAVIFLELGWRINHVIAITEMYEVAIGQCVQEELNHPLTDAEIAMVTAALHATPLAGNTDTNGGPLDVTLPHSLIDVRTLSLRMAQSGLSWRKYLALPPPEIATIMRALARMNVYVRGQNSPWTSYTCSLAFDLMIDALKNRGVTGQNVARAVGQTHHAIAARLERSRVLTSNPGFPNPLDNNLRLPVEEIVPMTGGFLRAIDPEAATSVPATNPGVRREDLHHYTATHSGNHTRAEWLLLRIGSPAASDVNPLPFLGVSALSALDTHSTPVLAGLHELTSVNAAGIHEHLSGMDDGRFAPVAIRGGSQTHTEACLNALARVQCDNDGLGRVYPLAVAEIAARVYDIDRYSYPDVLDPSEWVNGEMYTEALLMQAVATYDRDEVNIPQGRPGFGTDSHHRVPTRGLGDLVTLANHERDQDAFDVLSKDVRVSEGEFESALREFLSPALWDAFQRWDYECRRDDWPARFAEFNGRSLLGMCLHNPNHVLGLESLPIQRTAKRTTPSPVPHPQDAHETQTRMEPRENAIQGSASESSATVRGLCVNSLN
jgi:hypothetical protein